MNRGKDTVKTNFILEDIFIFTNQKFFKLSRFIVSICWRKNDYTSKGERKQLVIG